VTNEPIEGTKDREIRILRGGVRNIANKRVDVINIGRGQPSGLNVPEKRRRIDEISVPNGNGDRYTCVSEVNSGVAGGRGRSGQPGGRDDSFPGAVIAEGDVLLIVGENAKSRFELGKSCSRECRVLRSRPEQFLRIWLAVFPCNIDC